MKVKPNVISTRSVEILNLGVPTYGRRSEEAEEEKSSLTEVNLITLSFHSFIIHPGTGKASLPTPLLVKRISFGIR